MSKPWIEVRGLSVRYGSREVVSSIDLDLPRGEILALLGPSGAGKSTLLSALGQRLPAGAQATGEVRSTERLATSPMSQIPPTGATQVGALLGGNTSSLLDQLGLASAVATARLDELTLPERQLVAFGQVLAESPPLWLLDQPTWSLDDQRTARVEEILWNARTSASIVVVTHSLGQARRASHRTAMMERGLLVEHGPTAQIFVSPSDPRTARFVEGLSTSGSKS